VRNTKTRYPWGDEIPTPGLCNFDGEKKAPVAVTAFPKGASLFGAEQMCGNVAEWCLDCYSETFLKTLKKKFPGGAGRWAINPWNQLRKGGLHSVRGGSFEDDEEDIVVTRRSGLSGRSKFVGFRCAVWHVEKKK